MKNRKYLPTLSELLDRLSICQLKEWKLPEHKDEYAKEISDIVEDVQTILNETDVKVDARMLRAVIVCAQINAAIWENESAARKGIEAGNKLLLTHGLNGIRQVSKNVIQENFGGRLDYKTDCLAAEFKDWDVSWTKKEDNLEDCDCNLLTCRSCNCSGDNSK